MGKSELFRDAYEESGFKVKTESDELTTEELLMCIQHYSEEAEALIDKEDLDGAIDPLLNLYEVLIVRKFYLMLFSSLECLKILLPATSPVKNWNIWINCQVNLIRH